MTSAFGRPKLVASAPAPSDPAMPRPDAPRAIDALPESLPATLADQLAHALGAAEARCAVAERLKSQRVSIPLHCEARQPPSFINAETAPFLTDAESGPSHLPPSFLPPSALPAHALDASGVVGDWGGRGEMEFEHESNLDLPRFFERDRQIPEKPPVAFAGSASGLSASTMALGFVIGLAVVAPTLWLSQGGGTAPIAHRGAAMGLTAPLLAASAVATLVPSAALEVGERGGAPPSPAEQAMLGSAAFELAAQLIGIGDYMGARDALRQAVAFGEERARDMLDALE
jgi:hypothetical protein